MKAEKNEETVDKTKLKQAKNLFNSLIKDENREFYSVDKINRNLVAKAKRLVYAKEVFIKLYNELEIKIISISIKIINLIYFSLHYLLKKEKILIVRHFIVSKVPLSFFVLVLQILDFLLNLLLTQNTVC